MKRRSIVAAAVVLAIGGAVIARRREPAKPRSGPALAVRHAPRVVADGQEVEDRAVTLAMSSLTSAQREELRDGMDYVATRLEGSLLPGAEDLGDGDPVAELARLTRKYLPGLSAARSLARGEWSAKDISARAVADCRDPSIASDETCVPLWGDDAPPEASRARFLAWAASSSAVFETNTPKECAAALRAHVLEESSAIALVLGDDELELASFPERESLREAANRLGRALAAADRRDDAIQIDGVGRAPPPRGRALPWLDLGPRSVMVVPRLSALTRLSELNAAVEAAPACPAPRWIHRAGG